MCRKFAYTILVQLPLHRALNKGWSNLLIGALDACNSTLYPYTNKKKHREGLLKEGWSSPLIRTLDTCNSTLSPCCIKKKKKEKVSLNGQHMLCFCFTMLSEWLTKKSAIFLIKSTKKSQNCSWLACMHFTYSWWQFHVLWVLINSFDSRACRD